MATAIERTNIIKLVTTMFNAAPGAAYLADFVTFFDGTVGTSAQKLTALSNALASTTAYRTANPSFQLDTEFTSNLLTPFGLQANGEAITFVTTRFNAGMSKGQISNEAMAAIDASTSAAFADAKAILANKAAVAEYYSVTKATVSTSLATLQGVVASVTSAAASVTAANAATDVATAPVGQPFTLTTGADTGTLFVGGSGADTFNALFTTANGMTFGANDILDGGAGTDTLFIQVGATGVAGPATIRNIEVITANFSAAGTVNLLGATGVTTVESSGSSADAAFTNIGSATTALRVSNTATGASFGFTAAAVAGAADTANVTLNADTAGSLALTTGFETVALRSSGSANTLAGLTIGAPTTVTVAGDQALVLGTIAAPATLPASVTTFDASANTATAGVTATFGATTTAIAITGSTGNDTLNITNIVTSAFVLVAGAGNDIVIDNSAISAVTTMSGGDGTDTLVTIAASAEGYSTPAVRTISGFERVQESTPGTASATLTLANLDTGITNVTLGAGTAAQGTGIGAAGVFASTAGAYTISAPTGTLGLTLQGALGGALTIVAAGTATTDTANITVSPSTAALNVLAGQNIVDTQFETLNISTGSAATAAQTTGTVAITASTGGTSRLNITGVNAFSGTTLTAVTIDASGMTGAATFTNTGAGATTTSITGTANNDVIVGGSAAATLSGGAGADNITGGAGNDSISGGDGVDTITGGVGRDSLTGGAGADIFVFGANPASGTAVSNQAAPDTITDFVSGTDKLQIAQSITAFLGNFANFTTAQAAANTDGRGNLAYFVTSENNLYVQASAAGGVTAATDTVITLTGVAALTAGDLSVGSQGTVGAATVTLTQAAANVSNTATTGVNVATTTVDDTINSTAAFLVLSSVDGGAGTDTLNITTATGSTLTSLIGTGTPTGAQALVANVERVVFQAGAGTFAMQDTPNLAVNNTSTTAGMTALTMGAGAGQSFTSTGGIATGVTLGAGAGQSASISGGTATNSITLGAAGQSATITGLGTNTITTTVARAAGSTFIGGLGTSDTLAISDAGTVTLAAAAVSGTTAAYSAIDTVTLTAISTLNVTPTSALAVTQGAGATTVNGTGTGGTITVTGNGTSQANLLTLTGTSNFAVTTVNSNSSGITDTGTGTLSVTTTTTYAGAIASSTASLVTINEAATTSGVPTFGGTSNLVVNGLGTATTGTGGFTEINTHTGTAVTTTLNITGALISTSTLAGALGAVTVNDAHTGTGAANSVLATSTLTGRVITYNLTGATGDMQVTGTNAVTVNVTAGAHAIVTGGGNDTINISSTGTSAETINGGLGADNIVFSGAAAAGGIAHAIAIGVDAPTLITNSGVVIGQVFNTAVTGSFNVAALDKVTGFMPSDSIQLGAAVTFSATVIRNGAALGASATTGATGLIVGTYDVVAQSFLVSNAGTSTLFIYDQDGTGAGTSFGGVVLVGYVDALGNDTMATTGLLTAVA